MRHSRFQPDDFGDTGVRHEVNVFVYRYGDYGPEYLLLRPRPQVDSLWRPVVSAIGHDQDLRRAAVLAVRGEVGLDRPYDLVCPAAGIAEEIGDLKLVDWPVGYFLRDPQLPKLTATGGADTLWMGFRRALHQLGLSVHRQNLLQIHWGLAAA